MVVATSPKDPSGSVCKRVLALPGDRVCTNPDSFGIKRYQTIPKGHVWLQGDNLSNSTDSRSYGPVPLGLVKSKLLVRVWPPNQAKFVSHHYEPDDWPSEKAEGDIRSMMATKSTAPPALATSADNAAPVQPGTGHGDTPTATPTVASASAAKALGGADAAGPTGAAVGGAGAADADAVTLEATVATAARSAMLGTGTQVPAAPSTIGQSADRPGTS